MQKGCLYFTFVPHHHLGVEAACHTAAWTCRPNAAGRIRLYRGVDALPLTAFTARSKPGAQSTSLHVALTLRRRLRFMETGYTGTSINRPTRGKMLLARGLERPCRTTSHNRLDLSGLTAWGRGRLPTAWDRRRLPLGSGPTVWGRGGLPHPNLPSSSMAMLNRSPAQLPCFTEFMSDRNLTFQDTMFQQTPK